MSFIRKRTLGAAPPLAAPIMPIYESCRAGTPGDAFASQCVERNSNLNAVYVANTGIMEANLSAASYRESLEYWQRYPHATDQPQLSDLSPVAQMIATGQYDGHYLPYDRPLAGVEVTVLAAFANPNSYGFGYNPVPEVSSPDYAPVQPQPAPAPIVQTAIAPPPAPIVQTAIAPPPAPIVQTQIAPTAPPQSQPAATPPAQTAIAPPADPNAPRILNSPIAAVTAAAGQVQQTVQRAIDTAQQYPWWLWAGLAGLVFFASTRSKE